MSNAPCGLVIEMATKPITLALETGPQGPEGKPGPAVEIDATLSISGEAADAKAAGDAIRANAEELADQKSALDDLTALVDRKAGALIDTASGAIASFVPDSTIDNLLGVSVAVEPVQAGSGDPSPDNVRPISGWDAVGIETAGENLCPVKSFTSTATARVVNLVGIKALAGTTHTMSFDVTSLPGSDYRIGLLASTAPTQAQGTNVTDTIPGVGTIITANTLGRWTGTLTVNQDCYLYIRCVINGFTLDNIMIAEGTASTYKPYTGNTYAITLGQTVYGGTMDVTNGKMYARPFFPSYNGQTLIGPWVSSMDAYTPGATPTVGAQVVDMGGAVTEITLVPVTISTISGQTNNVWADAGDVSVEYAADLKTYIDSKIAAAVAALS